MKNTTNRKILKDLKSLQKVVRKEKGIGKIVAMISGSFDLLHYGHIEILESIKTKERTLIVLLNSDKSVRTYKGIGRPVINEWERTLSLAALSCVDYVFVFNDLNPVEIIKSTKPQEYWNGTDWSEECVEKEVVRSYGGILKIHNRGNHSTSKLIEKIID